MSAPPPAAISGATLTNGAEFNLHTVLAQCDIQGAALSNISQYFALTCSGSNPRCSTPALAGYPSRPVNLWRAAGAVLVVAGVLAMQLAPRE